MSLSTVGSDEEAENEEATRRIRSRRLRPSVRPGQIVDGRHVPYGEMANALRAHAKRLGLPHRVLGKEPITEPSIVVSRCGYVVVRPTKIKIAAVWTESVLTVGTESRVLKRGQAIVILTELPVQVKWTRLRRAHCPLVHESEIAATVSDNWQHGEHVCAARLRDRMYMVIRRNTAGGYGCICCDQTFGTLHEWFAHYPALSLPGKLKWIKLVFIEYVLYGQPTTLLDRAAASTPIREYVRRKTFCYEPFQRDVVALAAKGGPPRCTDTSRSFEAYYDPARGRTQIAGTHPPPVRNIYGVLTGYPPAVIPT